jgi:hypothetical protein
MPTVEALLGEKFSAISSGHLVLPSMCDNSRAHHLKIRFLILLRFSIFPPHLLVRCGDRSSNFVRKLIHCALREPNSVSSLCAERGHAAAAPSITAVIPQ